MSGGGESPIETFRTDTTESWRRAFLSMEYALVLENVTKRFGATVAVHDVSLRTPRGMIQGILGPDSAGKTTMIRMIMSIIPADSGTIEVLGSRRPETVKDSLGYLPQERGVYGAMTARQLVAYFGRLKGMPARSARARAEQLLGEYGLADWLDTRCESIPGCPRRIVQILCAIVHDPELVILDEPFSGLNTTTEDVIRNILLALKQQGRSVMVATRVAEQAEESCDHITMVAKGSKLLDGTLAEVKAAAQRQVLIDYEGDGSVLQRMAGVERLKDEGGRAELVLNDGTDPQEILELVAARIRIKRFDIRNPSLRDVYERTMAAEDRG